MEGMILRLYFESWELNIQKCGLPHVVGLKYLDHSIYFETPGDHADEMETSLMMYLKPDLVRPLAEAGSGHEHKSKIAAMQEGWLWAERPWSKISKDTGVGDPSNASAEKGALFLMKLQQNWRPCTLRFVTLT